ncbi:uncharacterized protein LOC111705453 [Eurytemora carolleeae]|uniref:uncharacterized protein LOC111705453 n=1 Tax=Eurytemora carolleeae TaxID=1294199 RepID=UPI000C75BD5A|nr:uncharacterized protein LOC111705453 [Eurytemora carolleeae]|eukprot:XP_023333776.1 uncharacterized protein LOC111705453 [Eurytemora affinis]
MLAAQKGFLEICRIILKKDSSILNMKAEDGATALMLGCQGGEVEVVELLLDAGAEVNHAAQDKTMAVHLASAAKKNSCTLLRLLLPKTDMNMVYSACTSTGDTTCVKKTGLSLLSPFHLAIDWENYQSLGLLSEYLSPSRFQIPIEECPVHSEYCSHFQMKRCRMFEYCSKDPLSHLLSVSNLPLNTTSLIDSLWSDDNTSGSLPPFIALLIGSREGDSNIYKNGDIRRQTLRYLIERGERIKEKDILPIVLLSPVSGLFGLIQEGLISPLSLINQRMLDSIRQLINQETYMRWSGFSSQNSTYLRLKCWTSCINSSSHPPLFNPSLELQFINPFINIQSPVQSHDQSLERRPEDDGPPASINKVEPASKYGRVSSLQ